MWPVGWPEWLEPAGFVCWVVIDRMVEVFGRNARARGNWAGASGFEAKSKTSALTAGSRACSAGAFAGGMTLSHYPQGGATFFSSFFCEEQVA